MVRPFFLTTLACLILVLGGCGDNSMSEVEGTVTVDGEPLAKGGITFVPTDGKSPTAGAEIVNGKYSAKVPVGMMKVSLSGEKVTQTRKLYNTPDSPVAKMTGEALPPEYNAKSTLTLEVKPGKQTKDWTITLKK